MPTPAQPLYSRRKRDGQASLAAAISKMSLAAQSQTSASPEIRGLYDCVESEDRCSTFYIDGSSPCPAGQSLVHLKARTEA